MALIKCPECGREISDRAPSCPMCGITKKDMQAIFAEKQKNTSEKIEELANVKQYTVLDKVEYDIEEFVDYPTVALVSGLEKRHYAKCQLTKRRRMCSVCGVEYDKYKYNTCPLCESKKKNDALVKKIQERENDDDEKTRIKYACKVGDVIKFGKYYGQPVEWIVLKAESKKALICSKYIIDIMPYNVDYKYITWENCTLRSYLNNEFIEKCFANEEKSRIEQTIIKNINNKKYGTEGGKDTSDRVFCLSVGELETYFGDDSARVAVATEYAKKKKAKMNELAYGLMSDGNWWLRSPGMGGWAAMSITGYGYIVDSTAVNFEGIGIRPALWLSL